MQIPVDLTGKEERISCLDAANLWKDDSTCSGDKFLCLILFVDFISWRRLLVCYLRFYFCCCAWVLMFIFWHTVVMERYTTGFAREMNSRCVALGLSSLGRRQRGVSICNKHQWPLVIWENLHPLLPYLKTPFAYELFLLHIKQRQTKT